jgi:putative membrane protein
VTVAGEPAHEPDRSEDAGEGGDGGVGAREAGEGTAAAADTHSPIRTLGAVYLKGAAMGAADTIPGVSGGTIALITGIYERFVRALTRLDPRILRHVPRLHRAEGRRDLLADLREMDFFFLVALGLGVLTAVVTLSRVVHAALVGFRAGTFAFFFGLIAASAVVLYDAVDVSTPGQGGAALVGFVFAFLVAGVSGASAVPHDLPVVFVAGAVGITAMVLPGISGAFILLLLGQYTYLTGTLSDFVDAILATATGGSGALVSLGTVVAVFVAGAAVGILTVAHVIRRALDTYRAATLAFLVSLMVGSLRLPAVEVAENVAVWTPASAAAVTAAGLVGAVAVLALDRYTEDLDY